MSILEVEMSAALQHPVGPHTVDEWLALPPAEDGARTELIFGYLHVSPAASNEHQFASLELAVLLRSAIAASGREDLFAVQAVNVKISSAIRTGLIPDVVIVDRKQRGTSYPAHALVVAVELWSPGNTREERETKMAAYAAAGVPFMWAVFEEDDPRLVAHRLERDRYVVENVVRPGGPATVTASPIPVTVDLDDIMDW
ncbi:Uma2 family endonuclease [Saccharothrix longispora]|uniref:Uma2 family endonuclease n=1 Tax=Saccharothrix longispora TaxID=33920 RepID=A0ABU1Q1Q1_9PSEU|nr:Uma2 family endonuclease [Saccharothrix longispora]MDR6596822.1 Uma2 family endonuclease [Saccharothrix longispora]